MHAAYDADRRAAAELRAALRREQKAAKAAEVLRESAVLRARELAEDCKGRARRAMAAEAALERERAETAALRKALASRDAELRKAQLGHSVASRALAEFEDDLDGRRELSATMRTLMRRVADLSGLVEQLHDDRREQQKTARVRKAVSCVPDGRDIGASASAAASAPAADTGVRRYQQQGRSPRRRRNQRSF